MIIFYGICLYFISVGILFFFKLIVEYDNSYDAIRFSLFWPIRFVAFIIHLFVMTIKDIREDYFR